MTRTDHCGLFGIFYFPRLKGPTHYSGYGCDVFSLRSSWLCVGLPSLCYIWPGWILTWCTFIGTAASWTLHTSSWTLTTRQVRSLHSSIILDRRYIFLPLHPFPFLCGVSLRQVVPDVIQPPPLRSSSPYFLRHLHHHHSLAHIFSSQYMHIPHQPIFMHFPGYFSHLRCPSNYFIPNAVQLGDSTHPS